VHATVAKVGFAVARCSLDEVLPVQIREVPLWMLDTAACCRMRSAKSSSVIVESLSDLKALLRSVVRTERELESQIRHRYLLNAGGADVGVLEATEIRAAGVVCSAKAEAGLAGAFARDTTESSTLADTAIAAAGHTTSQHSGGRGGMR
jgi:hypothetical protein